MRRLRAKAQAITEFAFTMPMFMLFVFCTIELALVFVFYYSEVNVARDSTRWLAVHRTSTDDVVATYVHDTQLPGMVTGTPTLVQAGSATQDTIYDIGQMRIQFAPCVPSGGNCTRAERAAGATLYLQATYSVSNILFLPTTFRLGSLAVGMPTALPPYKVYVMAE